MKNKLGYTWYPRDYLSDPDVMFMTAAERGVYRDLIDLAYMNENRIKYSVEKLAKYTNSDIDTVQKVLDEKGEKQGDCWTIPSCEKRIKLAEKNHKNGSNGGRPKTQNSDSGKTQTKPKNNPEETQTKTQTERQRERERESEKERNDDVVSAREPETKPSPPPSDFGFDPSVLKHVEDIKAECLTDPIFSEHVCRQTKIDPSEVPKWLGEFNEHLKFAEITMKNRSDYRIHFVNWLRKKQQSKNPKNATAKSQRSSANIYR